MLEALIAGFSFIKDAVAALAGLKTAHSEEKTKQGIIALHIALTKLQWDGTQMLGALDNALAMQSRKELVEFITRYMKCADTFRRLNASHELDEEKSGMLSSLGIWIPDAVSSIFRAFAGSGDLFTKDVRDELFRRLVPSKFTPEFFSYKNLFNLVERRHLYEWTIDEMIVSKLDEDELIVCFTNLKLLGEQFLVAHVSLSQGIEELRKLICSLYDFHTISRTVHGLKKAP